MLRYVSTCFNLNLWIRNWRPLWFNRTGSRGRGPAGEDLGGNSCKRNFKIDQHDQRISKKKSKFFRSVGCLHVFFNTPLKKSPWKKNDFFKIAMDAQPWPGYAAHVLEHFLALGRLHLVRLAQRMEPAQRAHVQLLQLLGIGKAHGVVWLCHGLYTKDGRKCWIERLNNVEHDNQFPVELCFPICGSRWVCSRHGVPRCIHPLQGACRGILVSLVPFASVGGPAMSRFESLGVEFNAASAYFDWLYFVATICNEMSMVASRKPRVSTYVDALASLNFSLVIRDDMPRPFGSWPSSSFSLRWGVLSTYDTWYSLRCLGFWRLGFFFGGSVPRSWPQFYKNLRSLTFYLQLSCKNLIHRWGDCYPRIAGYAVLSMYPSAQFLRLRQLPCTCAVCLIAQACERRVWTTNLGSPAGYENHMYCLVEHV